MKSRPRKPAPSVAEPPPCTRTGDIREHERFVSRHLGNERTIVVYLPPGYDRDAPARYPVLYMHDGQNVFDAATSAIGVEWEVDETAERLIEQGRIHPLVVVGIYNNAERTVEYAAPVGQNPGRADLYGRFLVEELKPFIDRTYRTLPGREHTAVAGSSLGGTLSLYLAAAHGDCFSMCAPISPAIWWQGRVFMNHCVAALKDQDLYLVVGTHESQTAEGNRRYLFGVRALVEALEKAGWKRGKDFAYEEVAGGRHNEADWARQMERVLLRFFAP